MPRPPKERRVEFIPDVKYFKPAGVPLRELAEIVLSIEEVEAIRLKDEEGLNQEESAQRMQVSRATFQRVLQEARQKIASALIHGKAIRFAGGDYRLAQGNYFCRQCSEEFKEVEEATECPQCGSTLEKVYPHRENCHRRGQGRA